jgi:cytochrome c-type biogenesis protein CcmH/NrfG
LLDSIFHSRRPVAGKSRKEQILELLAEEPNDPFLRYGLAMEYVSEGNDDEAVRWLRELLRSSENYVPGHLQLGQALLRLGRLEEAKTAWERGVRVARVQGEQHAAEEMQGFLESMPG